MVVINGLVCGISVSRHFLNDTNKIHVSYVMCANVWKTKFKCAILFMINVCNQCLKISLITCCSWSYEFIYWCTRVLSTSTCSSHTPVLDYRPGSSHSRESYRGCSILMRFPLFHALLFALCSTCSTLRALLSRFISFFYS